MTGRVHSFQSMGAVDGPGLRGVVFLQGCPLRCAYCHNPDTWEFAGGEETEASALAARILRLKNFYKKGGVTVSGGEPLMQGEFVRELFQIMHENGLHTALDTSGIGTDEQIDAALTHTDLVLCDIKFPDADLYRRHAGADMNRVLEFLREVERRNIPLWVRHVVVPGLTDGEESAKAVAKIARSFKNLERIELLPFRKICLPKYEALQIPFPLADTPECPAETIARLEALIGVDASANSEPATPQRSKNGC